MDGQSLLVGKTVVFSVNKETKLTGIVLDKIQMLQKPDDQVTVTGYIIQEAQGKQKLYNNIAYWRIEDVLN